MSHPSLEGASVIVTGGTSGIGKATARRFLDEGSRVVICGIDEDELNAALQDLGRPGQVEGMICDVSVEKEVASLIEFAEATFGGCDVLVNNAGTSDKSNFVDISTEDWDRIISVNLRGIFLVARTVAKRMVNVGGNGSIVNMASTNALLGEVELAHYNASKGGVLLLTRTMAAELGPKGIRVNAVCPGYIWTPLSARLDSKEKGERYARRHIPLGRMGRPEEVAAAIAFLASEDASFVNGENLVIDGGQVII